MRKILALVTAFAVILTLTACKTEKTESSVYSSAADESTESSLPSVMPAENTDDIEDPQNSENSKGDGEKVKAEKLEHKTGLQNGIDVSKWQGKIDWAKVKKSGIDFAVIRIGFRGENGTLYKDDNADYNIQQAIKAGVLVGVYFFSTAVNVNEALAEASFVLSAVKGYSISYPIVYDCEGYDDSDSRMNALTSKERTDNAVAFLSAVKKVGYTAMFYASKNDLQNGSWETERLEQISKIWIAQYTSPAYPETKAPDYNGKYDMWQYTNKGAVNGISGNCDMVISYFTEKLKKSKDSKFVPKEAEIPKTESESGI